MASSDFIRVGTNIYKLVNKPMPDGSTMPARVKWSLQMLRIDHSKDEIREIPTYDGFCTIPSHVDYHREVNRFYNRYEPISHVPLPGEWPNIERLIRHIFGDQFELALDYFQILYLMPEHQLPILMLVSKERGTGKTTFLNFLKAIFEDNATFITNENFHSIFNTDWMGKLLVMIDETSLNRREDSERLKNLSTARKFKSEGKGTNREEVEFFGKFVLCSNDENCPLFIDAEETRYWVRKVCRLETDDTAFLPKLAAEIPAFLHSLLHRQLSTKPESRMWFKPELIRTAALERIIRANRSPIEIDMIEMIEDVMASLQTDKFQCTPKDVVCLLNYRQVSSTTAQIRKVLSQIWKLDPAGNSLSYTKVKPGLSNSVPFLTETDKGRYFTITSEFIKKMLR